ncbi:MAG: RNA-binding protein [Roseiarcus sp.]
MRTRIDSEEKGPERTCVVSGLKGSPETMLRFALSGEGAVVPDIRQKLPGRGVWTRLSRAVVRQAAAKQAFSRGFRASVRAGADLADEVDGLLEQDALRFLSLVNKAGLVTIGGAKVEAAIRAANSKRNLAALIQASDGARDGASKLQKLLDGVLGDLGESVARINLFDSRRLDLALGRTNVIHAALTAGPASAAFLAKVARLILYRSGVGASVEVPAIVGAAGATSEIFDTSRE